MCICLTNQIGEYVMIGIIQFWQFFWDLQILKTVVALLDIVVVSMVIVEPQPLIVDKDVNQVLVSPPPDQPPPVRAPAAQSIQTFMPLGIVT